MRRDEAIRRAEQWMRGRETHSLSDIADLIAAVDREALEEALAIADRHSDAAPKYPAEAWELLEALCTELRGRCAGDAP